MRRQVSFAMGSFIAIAAVLALILLFVFAGSWHPSPELPELLQPSEEDGLNPDYEALDITDDNVKSVVAALSRPESYYAETRSEVHHDGRKNEYLRRKWVRGDVSRLDIFGNGWQPAMSAVFDAESVYYWYANSVRVTQLARGEFSPEDEQMLIDYADLLTVEKVSNAKLLNYNGETCIYAEGMRGNVRECYWISVQSGLLKHGEVYEGDALIYSVEMLELNISEQGKEHFTLPDGRVLINA